MTGNLSKKRVDMEVAESIKASIKDSKEVTKNVHSAVEKYPKIVDGYWHVWNAESGAFESTGIKAQGEKGEPGPQGEKGEVGEAGQNGKDGYTPQKGTDYWTDEDKEEIVSQVKEELGDMQIDDAMSDSSENAVQNKVVKKYVDEEVSHINLAINQLKDSCNDFKQVITKECLIEDRNDEIIAEATRVTNAKAYGSNSGRHDVMVTVACSDLMDINDTCYLDVYNTTLQQKLRNSIYPSKVYGGVATFLFTVYESEFAVVPKWTTKPYSNSCTVEVTYLRDIMVVIGDIETAIDEKADVTYVDETIQSAILDSWEVPV